MIRISDSTGEVIISLDNGDIKDKEGNTLYTYTKEYFRVYNGGIRYKFGFDSIRDALGRTLYKFDGTYLRDYNWKNILWVDKEKLHMVKEDINYRIEGSLEKTDYLAIACAIVSYRKDKKEELVHD